MGSGASPFWLFFPAWFAFHCWYFFGRRTRRFYSATEDLSITHKALDTEPRIR